MGPPAVSSIEDYNESHSIRVNSGHLRGLLRLALSIRTRKWSKMSAEQRVRHTTSGCSTILRGNNGGFVWSIYQLGVSTAEIMHARKPDCGHPGVKTWIWSFLISTKAMRVTGRPLRELPAFFHTLGLWQWRNGEPGAAQWNYDPAGKFRSVTILNRSIPRQKRAWES